MRQAWVLVALAVAPVAAPVMAQEDAMELQRCVWRCLADSPGADSAEYGQCVAAQCNESGSAAAATLPQPVGPPWSGGRTADGMGHYAGQADPATGNAFYLTCDAGGARNLLLSGEVEGPSAVLSLDLDGEVFGLWFETSPGGYTALLEPGSPIPGRLQGGRDVTLRNGIGTELGRFPMAGAQAAIGAALAACGG